GGEPCIEERAHDLDRRARRLLGRLENDRAAGGHRRAELARGIADREIPGCEGGDGSDRLLEHERSRPGRADEDAAVAAPALLAVELEEIRSDLRFDACLRERLALLERRYAGNV